MTPKSLFLGDKPRAQRFRDALTPDMQYALLVAFNEFCFSELPSSSSPERVMWANAMREGAKKYIEVLTSLGDEHIQRTPPARGGLLDPDATYQKRHARPTG